MATVSHELSHSLAEERLKAIVLLDDGVDKDEPSLILKLELKQVSEVDEHRHLLLVAKLLGLKWVVPHLAICFSELFFSCPLDVGMVVGILLSELVAEMSVL